MNQPLDDKGHACRVGASIGIAMGKEAEFDGRGTMVDADIALYEAKSSGKNRFVFFSAPLQESTINRKKLSDRLIVAVENEEFVPYCQPQFYSETLGLRGLETLCRWHHPDLGVLIPGGFLEQAEESTLVGKIDQILLRKVMADMQYLRNSGFDIPKVSFNVTADRLMQADLADALTRSAVSGTSVAVGLLGPCHWTVSARA